MPNFDGRGPRGLGPLSGRGRGYCVINWHRILLIVLLFLSIARFFEREEVKE